MKDPGYVSATLALGHLSGMSLTLKVLIALLAGFALGIPLADSESMFKTGLLAVLGPVGTLFINAIRMTVIPLVVSVLIVGVTSAPDPRAVGRIGGRAIVLFLLAVSLAAAVGVLLGTPLLAMIPLDASAVESLRGGAAGSAAAAVESARNIPSAGEWLVSLVPANPIKAAADGAMLPLIVTSVAFAVALVQVAPARRAAVVTIVEGVMDASLALVRGILTLAPIGVFALAVPLGAKMGTGALGAIAGYIVIVSGICVLFSLGVLYPAAVVIGQVPFRIFARAVLPAQTIAFSGRSSLAALPAMLESVHQTLRLPTTIGNFLIPLASSMFRVGAGIGQTVGVIFLARLYGVDLGADDLLTIGVTSILTSFSVPGVPGGSIIIMVPVLMSAGIPAEGIGILLGADTIPDMFRTTTNVTGHMTAAVILAHGEREPT